MLTCIIVAHKRFEHYHLENLCFNNDIRIVLVLPLYSSKLLHSTTQSRCNQIYRVEKINFDTLSLVIDKELSTYSSAENIRIVCNDEMFLIEVGKIRRKFSIHGPKDFDYLRFRDKILMKEILVRNNLRVPKFCRVSIQKLRVTPEENYKSLKCFFNGIFFVKPSFGASAINAFKISSFVEFQRWINLDDIDDDYNCDEYFEGTLYLCETFIDKAKIIFSEVCEYSYPCIEYDKGLPLGIIPLHTNNVIRNNIVNFASRVCKYLNTPDGPTHLEVFRLTNGEIVFLEIGARPGGAGVPKILEKNYGFNTYEQTLKQALNIPIDDKVINSSFFYAEIFWAQKRGIVDELIVPELECNTDIDWFIKVGDKFITKPSGTVTPIAVKMYLSSNDYKRLYTSFIKLKSFSPIKYKNTT